MFTASVIFDPSPFTRSALPGAIVSSGIAPPVGTIVPPELKVITPVAGLIVAVLSTVCPATGLELYNFQPVVPPAVASHH